MRYMKEVNFVDVIGLGWYGQKMTYRYELSRYDLENIISDEITGDVPVNDDNLKERFTRENVEDWLTSHAGDFQKVIDFEATAGDVWIDFADEENEMDFNDIMFPIEVEEESCID